MSHADICSRVYQAEQISSAKALGQEHDLHPGGTTEASMPGVEWKNVRMVGADMGRPA